MDLKLINTAKLIVTTAQHWDRMSRRWKQRAAIHRIRLCIFDELHLVGGDGGQRMEVVVSRMRSMSVLLAKSIRLIGLSVSLGNAKDMGEWLGCTPENTYNFHPSARPTPLEIHMMAFSIHHHDSLMLTMAKPAYKHTRDKTHCVVFVDSARQCQLTATEFITFFCAENDSKSPSTASFDDLSLARCDECSFGFLHPCLSARDTQTVLERFSSGQMKSLIVSRECCWSLFDTQGLPLAISTVVIMGTRYFDGHEHRYVEYSLSDVLQMCGLAGGEGEDDSGQVVRISPILICRIS